MVWNWTQATCQSFLSLSNQPDILIRVTFGDKSSLNSPKCHREFVDANDFAFHDTAQSYPTEQE